jgi:uncharacterized protein YndB with AHSA1/START domain
MSARILDTRALQYELEVVIDASPEKVWRALTEDTNAWWLPDFHMVGEGSRVRLEARAGGQLIEEREDGGSLLWYTVLMCTPGKALHLAGHVGPKWGGPATTLLELELEERQGKTALRIADALVGHVADETVASLESGWRQLFTEGLKSYVEGS